MKSAFFLNSATAVHNRLKTFLKSSYLRNGTQCMEFRANMANFVGFESSRHCYS